MIWQKRGFGKDVYFYEPSLCNDLESESESMIVQVYPADSVLLVLVSVLLV